MANMLWDEVKLVGVCRHNHIIYLGLFGSFARGESKPGSDVDLLARFSKKKSLLDLVRIEREFSEMLKKPVDLLTESAISPYLIDRIKSEVKVVYEEK